MIIVITGVPGSGKTLFSIDYVRNMAAQDDRPVYYSGIVELKLPWIEWDATKWDELPANGIMVIDECQRVFRPRPSGSAVPPYVQALETHRHKGIDLVLITQNPRLLDVNVRALTGKHIHIHRRFGSHTATVMEWPQIKDSCATSHGDAFKRSWSYPKDVFKLYKSAEVHTHKLQLPRQVWYLLALIIIFIGGVYWVASRKVADIKGGTHGAVVAGAVGVDGSPGQPRGGGPDRWVPDFRPRIEGLAYTAPAYDQVTRPTRAPLPVACVASGDRCQCYTQQGTRLHTTSQLCRDIVAGGFFLAFDDRGEVVARPAGGAVPLQDSVAVGGHTSLGGQPNGSRFAAGPVGAQAGAAR